MFYRTHLMLQHEAAGPAETRAGWTRDALFRALDERFTFTDEITRSFAADVFWRCVLPKIQPPIGLIKGRWMVPGGMYYGNPKVYYGCYIWDTAFMVDVLSWLPGGNEIVLEVMENYCDATIMNAIRWGDVNERYCCDTGKPLGVPDLGMSSCVFAMMTDGMTRRFGAVAR